MSESQGVARAQFHAYVRHMASMRAQLERVWRGDLVTITDEAWDRRGSRAAAEALAPALGHEFDFVGGVDACRERLTQQAAAGADVSGVTIDLGGSEAFGQAMECLLR